MATTPLPGASPARHKVVYLDDNGPKTARVLPSYRRHRKPCRKRQSYLEHDHDETAAVTLHVGPLEQSTCGGGTAPVTDDETAPPEMKPLLIVDVSNASSDQSASDRSGVVDLAATTKLNGSVPSVAVTVDVPAAAAARSSSRWRRLQNSLALRRRVSERLSACEWWRSRRRRRLGADLADFPAHKQNKLGSKSFPDDDDNCHECYYSSSVDH